MCLKLRIAVHVILNLMRIPVLSARLCVCPFLGYFCVPIVVCLCIHVCVCELANACAFVYASLLVSVCLQSHLQNVTSLISLDLSGNNISAEGAKSISNNLIGNSHFRQLVWPSPWTLYSAQPF